MVLYDPAVTRMFAQSLYDRASTVVAIHTVIGVLAGSIVGGFGFGRLATLILVVIAGAIGYFIGSQKAFLLKLQAQTALCQVAIEENTRSNASPRMTSTISPKEHAPSSVSPTTPPAAPLGPMGRCPNCSAAIPLASIDCPNCRASFGEGSTWQVLQN